MGDDIEYSYDQLIYKPPGTSVELLFHQDAGYGWPGRANSRGMTSWLALLALDVKVILAPPCIFH